MTSNLTRLAERAAADQAAWLATIEDAAARGAARQVATEEPWLDKQALADHLSCSVRWVEFRMADGMPHSAVAGRPKFQLGAVVPWLREHGHIDERGEAVSG